MTLRSLAAAALTGAALLAPAAPADALICDGGVQNCPAYYLDKVQDASAPIRHEIDDLVERPRIDPRDLVEQKCWDIPPYFNDVCVP